VPQELCKNVTIGRATWRAKGQSKGQQLKLDNKANNEPATTQTAMCPQNKHQTDLSGHELIMRSAGQANNQQKAKQTMQPKEPTQNQTKW
jgi:hypothetical protein